MRTNLPITQNEYPLPEGVTIVSTTDLRGHILTANQAFIEASGYTWEELKGQPHNILRHIDVPEAVFKDFWDTLRKGLPWSQIVKNRRKNGDHYWVEARATPMFEQGKVVGYLSVRTAATREQIAAAEQAYRLIDAGKLRLVGGRPVGILEPVYRFVRRFNLAYVVTFFIALLTLFPLLSQAYDYRFPFWLEGGLGLLTIVGVYYFLRHHSRQLAHYAHVMRDMTEGHFRSQVDIYADAPFEKLSSRTQLPASLRAMQVNLGNHVESTQRMLDEATRVQSALNTATASVMVADTTHTLVFANQALQRLFDQRCAEIQQAIPAFDARHLVGHSMARLLAFMGLEKLDLQALNSVQMQTLRVGSLTFQLCLAPVNAQDGRRIGTVVEWQDKTQQLAIESQIAALIESAARGHLDQEIDTQGLTGFYLALSEQFNLLVGNLRQAVQQVALVAMAMSEGDMTQTVQGDFEGDLLLLKNSLNRSIDQLATTVTGIEQSSETIKTATTEVAQGSLDLSQRTQEQAASLEQTAASMEQMTATVKQNTDAAMHASQLAQLARNKADDGGLVGQKAREAMTEITHSAEKISAIIRLIDGIAFQTNLLALNAAVEAARAGEHGRGFAVVAGEVRSLAQKSAEASKDIKQLIDASTRSVSQGADYVEKTVASLGEINEAIRKVNDIVSEIASASKEQATGIQQVNQAIMQMDSVTQQNAALVEQTSAAAESMQTQAEEMVRVVNFFKTSQQHHDTVGVVRRSADSAQLMRAKDAHAQFLSRIQSMFLGAIPLTSVNNHHTCDFGQWLDAQGREALQAIDLAEPMDRLHIRFHGLGQSMVQSLRNGDRKAAKQILDEAEALSVELMQLMEQAARSVQIQPNATRPSPASAPVATLQAKPQSSSQAPAKDWSEF